jgi:hypothetical protein
MQLRSSPDGISIDISFWLLGLIIERTVLAILSALALVSSYLSTKVRAEPAADSEVTVTYCWTNESRRNADSVNP